MSAIRVVLTDDHPVVLAGIRALLLAAPEIVLVAEASTGLAGLAAIRELLPDVAVLDLSLPDIGGVELARRLARECPGVRLLALTAHEDRAYVQQLLACGARGYLLKRSAAEELVRAIRAVHAGGVYLDPAVAAKAVTGSAGTAEPADRPGLSEREQRVLRLTARGLSNKEIAARLEISAKTVETYKARACEKLGLRTRAEIVRHGAAHGWLDGLALPDGSA